MARPNTSSSRPTYRDKKRSSGSDNYSRKSRPINASSSGSYSGSSGFSGSDSESYSGSDWDSASGTESDSGSDSRSGSSYTTPSSDSENSNSSASDDSRELPTTPAKKSNHVRDVTRSNPGASRLAMAAALALQRRKKESPKLRATMEKKKVREVDYDVNPTKLYQYIEKNMWREAAERCRNVPVDANTWVYRANKQHGLMWRMLPLHTAVLYRAPVYVLLDILEANPNGPSEPDDRKMLPIHMACRILCKEDVLRLLMKYCPTSLYSEDIKGRTPKQLLLDQKKDKSQSRSLQKVNAKNRKQLIHILEKGEDENERRGMPDQEQIPFKSSGSVATGRPQVRMRKKKFTSFDQPKGSLKATSSISSKDRYNTRDPLATRDTRTAIRDSVPAGIQTTDRSIPKNPSSARGGSVTRNRSSSRDRSVAKDSPSSMDSSSRRGRLEARNGSSDDQVEIPLRSHSKSRNDAIGRSPNSSANNATKLPPRSSKKTSQSGESKKKGRKKSDFTNDGSGSSTWDDPDKITSNQQESSDDMADISGLSEHDMGLEPSVDVSESPQTNEKVYADTNEHSDHGSSSDDSDNEYLDLESLTELWIDVEGQNPLVYEASTNAVQQVAEAGQPNSKAEKSRRKVKPLKFYEPPTELKKLLNIIQSPAEDIGAMEVQGRSGPPRSNINGTARRVNACGALKALAKKEKNRLRLARTKGVVSSVCFMLIDPDSSVEERIRCSTTLLSLCVPNQNWEPITTIHGDIFENFGNIMDNDDGKVLYNVCFSLFLLAKSEQNRNMICVNEPLTNAISRILELPDAEDSVVIDGESLEINNNLGSPSGIRYQGSPTTNNESQRGSRMCVLKSLLSIVKTQDNALIMASNHKIIAAMTNILGTMAPQENLLCVAIFTNLTRHKENCEYLVIDHPGFISTLLEIATSEDPECKKCAILALQNLSCDKICSQDFIKYPESLSIICKIASKQESNLDTRMSALHTLKNLCNEPSSMPTLVENDFVMPTLCIIAKDKKNLALQLIACDALATLSQWLYSSAESCLEKNNINIGNRPLGSMACTWDQWH